MINSNRNGNFKNMNSNFFKLNKYLNGLDRERNGVNNPTRTLFHNIYYWSSLVCGVY